jgi:hypothetical protein
VKSVQFAKIDDELTAVGVDHPILTYSAAIEELLLDSFIPASGAL